MKIENYLEMNRVRSADDAERIAAQGGLRWGECYDGWFYVGTEHDLLDLGITPQPFSR